MNKNTIIIKGLEIDTKLYPRRLVEDVKLLSYLELAESTKDYNTDTYSVSEYTAKYASIGSILTKIKEEHDISKLDLDKVCIFKTQDRYDDYLSYHVSSIREESDDEYHKRVKQRITQEETRDAAQYRQYIELKKKYEK